MSSLQSDCPFTIRVLSSTSQSHIYLIREHDPFGEYPNIFAKVYYDELGQRPAVVILSDSGTGINVENKSKELPPTILALRDDLNRQAPPSHWNIASFLGLTLNPNHAAPYIVLTTHCHYDHIGGIQHLLSVQGNAEVYSSSRDIGYLTPWSNLQRHSLCQLLGLMAPKYNARFIEDSHRITYGDRKHDGRKISSITVMHTPGHSPDSISWYDHEIHVLCVGDMFYEKESELTRSGSDGHWAREPPQPVIFTRDSNIIDWAASMHRLLDFVRAENRKLGVSEVNQQVRYRQDGQGTPVDFAEAAAADDGWHLVNAIPSRRRVALCASHVSIGTDAELALLNMLDFMLKVQLDQVSKRKTHDIEGSEDVWLWDENLNDKPQEGIDDIFCFSVKAPWSIIHPMVKTGISTNIASSMSQVNAGSRSTLLRRMVSNSSIRHKATDLKSNALASVSHNNVMADRPTPTSTLHTRKG